MRILKKWWSALETIPGPAVERLEWKRILEDEWPVAAPYLRPAGRVVEQVWCTSPGGDGCPRQVVCHDDGRIVAVCGDRPKRCDPLDLDLEDLVVLEVDWARLRTALVRIFEVNSATAADLRHGLYRLGEHLIASGTGFPVVLLTPDGTSSQPLAALPALPAALDGPRPLVLLAPTRTLLGDGLLDALKARGGLAVPLMEEVGADGAGSLASLRLAAEIFGPVRDRLIQQHKIRAPEHRFPTPPGTTWEQITIRFITQHQVHVQAGSETGVYEFTQMGMADTRKKPAEPDVQWQLLLDFAESGGAFTWEHSNAGRSKQKTKEKLANALKSFFGIGDDPFENLPNGYGWRARFTIMPEA